MTGGTWDDQDDFNGLSEEANEALRGQEKNSILILFETNDFFFFVVIVFL